MLNLRPPQLIKMSLIQGATLEPLELTNKSSFLKRKIYNYLRVAGSPRDMLDFLVLLANDLAVSCFAWGVAMAPLLISR